MATYLLLHGAGHDGWCWTFVGERLTADGHVVVAPALPCDVPEVDLDGSVRVAEDALDADRDGRDGDELVVVGHSPGALTAAVVAARALHHDCTPDMIRQACEHPPMLSRPDDLTAILTGS